MTYDDFEKWSLRALKQYPLYIEISPGNYQKVYTFNMDYFLEAGRSVIILAPRWEKE